MGWKIAAAVGLFLLLGFLWQREACDQWREDYRVSWQNIYRASEFIDADTGACLLSDGCPSLQRGAEVLENKPPMCSKPEIAIP